MIRALIVAWRLWRDPALCFSWPRAWRTARQMAKVPASLRDMTEADFDQAHGIAPAGAPDVAGLIADLRSVASRPLAQETFADTWLTKAADALAALQSQYENECEKFQLAYNVNCQQAKRIKELEEALGHFTKRFMVDKIEAQQAERIKELEAKLAQAVDVIADDAYAISFQSMGQYRSALLKKLREVMG